MQFLYSNVNVVLTGGKTSDTLRKTRTQNWKKNSFVSISFSKRCSRERRDLVENKEQKKKERKITQLGQSTRTARQIRFVRIGHLPALCTNKQRITRCKRVKEKKETAKQRCWTKGRVPFRAIVSPSLTETRPLIPLARLPWRVSSERTRNLSSRTPRFESTHLASIRPFSRFKFTRWGRQSREFDGERSIERRRTGNTAFRMFYFVVWAKESLIAFVWNIERFAWNVERFVWLLLGSHI